MDSYEKIVNYWKKLNIKTAFDLESDDALDNKSISFAYNSCKIENENVTYYDTRDIFERDCVCSYTGNLKTLFEIQNAKEANKFIIFSFDNKRKIDMQFVKELQKILTQRAYDEGRLNKGERPGEFKHHDYVVGKNQTGASAEEIPEKINELLDKIQDIDENHAFEAATYFHAEFECIHPFADGNGRTGRLLMNYFLIMHNHPPIIIFEENKMEYYEALDAWDTSKNLDKLSNYLKEQCAKTWEKRIAMSEHTTNIEN